MIKRRNMNSGVNANISLEPASAAQSNSNINNNIIINRREDGKEDIVITRDVNLTDDPQHTESNMDVRSLILETYARILLDQDKALISNLISKRTIIVPQSDLVSIIKAMTGGEVEVYIDDNAGGCCAAKVSPIQKIDAIKVVTESGEVITDFKTVYNKHYNELVNNYHLNLKYVVV